MNASHIVDSLRYALTPEARAAVYQRQLKLEQRRVRNLRSLVLVMFFITLASLAFAVGVITQWL